MPQAPRLADVSAERDAGHQRPILLDRAPSLLQRIRSVGTDQEVCGLSEAPLSNIGPLLPKRDISGFARSARDAFERGAVAVVTLGQCRKEGSKVGHGL